MTVTFIQELPKKGASTLLPPTHTDTRVLFRNFHPLQKKGINFFPYFIDCQLPASTQILCRPSVAAKQITTKALGATLQESS